MLHHIANDPLVIHAHHHWHPPRIINNNILLLKDVVRNLPAMALHDPATRIGNRLLDTCHHIMVTIPASPPRSSKVFAQWAAAWMQQCQGDLFHKTGIGSDGSYQIKGQGVSAFVVQQDNVVIHSHSFLVVAHSSYDAEMQAANATIHYMAQNVRGQVLVFIDNQATLKSLFSTKPHTAFALSLNNCKTMDAWLASSADNMAKFRWMPSHLGFPLNELADKATKFTPIGPPAFPHHTLASRLCMNWAFVITEWCSMWNVFAASKALKLKKKNKSLYQPNVWDGKGKQFSHLAADIMTFSQFTRLVSGHLPTGEYRQRFFPQDAHV